MNHLQQMPAKHVSLRFLEATSERSDLSVRQKALFSLLAVPSILVFFCLVFFFPSPFIFTFLFRKIYIKKKKINKKLLP